MLLNYLFYKLKTADKNGSPAWQWVAVEERCELGAELKRGKFVHGRNRVA